MKTKLNLSITILIVLLSFTSCQKENVNLEQRTDTQNASEVSVDSSSLTSGEICQNLSNDPNLSLLIDILTEDNFVYNSIQQNSANESNWNNLNSFLEGQDPTGVVNQIDIEYYIGAEHTAFLSYAENVTNTMGSLISTHLSTLNETEVIEAFDCAITEYLISAGMAASSLSNKSNKNKSETRTSCCQGAKNRYLNCIRNAKSSGAATFTAHVVIGIGGAIVTMNGGPVFWGICTGLVHGGLGYLSDAKNCRSTCALEASQCNPQCTSACS